MSRCTILWADDDPDDIEVFREVLSSLGDQYNLLTFSNGRELLDDLYKRDKEHFPHLIILDMNMPVLSGKETLAILKSSEEYSSIPTVVFTTSSGELDQMYCQRLGTAMITKPVQYIQLRAAIETALSHRRPLTFRKRFRK